MRKWARTQGAVQSKKSRERVLKARGSLLDCPPLHLRLRQILLLKSRKTGFHKTFAASFGLVVRILTPVNHLARLI